MHVSLKIALGIVVIAQTYLAAAEPVALVQGTSSMPNEAERRYGVSVTERLSRWLAEIPIPHTTLTDDTLTTERLKHVSVLILGYNPTPTPKTLATLKRYIDRGGKLIVFYSASPPLADMMGVRLGEYRGAKGKKCWIGMQFMAQDRSAFPDRIHQQSRSIRPVFPVARSTKITAVWNNERGKSSGLPAVVSSPHGTWITHVLLDDGDAPNKKKLLLACVGKHLPEIWRTVATQAVKTCGSIGNYNSPATAWRDIHAQITAPQAPASARQHYRRATAHYQAAKDAILQNRFQDTVQLCQEANAALTDAVAVSQLPRANEIRGVWDHSGLGLYPGDWNRTCRQLREAGITDLYVNLLWAGKAHYASKIVPRSRTYADYGDQAAACVKAGRRYGIRIHAWKVCWNLAGASPAFLAELKKAGRLQVSEKGETVPWLCPSRADNVQYEVGAIREFVSRYRVGGIHLDYIRYRDSRVCFCESCQRGFSRDTGLKVTPWPQALRTPSLRAAYNQWRCGRITHLVRETRESLQELSPSTQLSVAVFGRYPQCVASVAQDWHLWLKRDYVDTVCPMNYTSDPAAFRRWLSDQTALLGAAGRILPGIGVTAKECNLDPIQVIEQIREIRRQRQPGYILFDLNQTLAAETLPALALGIAAE
jgi:uncharacterized lipoprotein YddW (UPF0748 family)